MQRKKPMLKTKSGMFFEGNCKEVLSALIQKKHLINENKNHSHIRPLLIVLSGIMRGADGGGRTQALQELGLIDSFDNMLGISTGAGIVAYAASHQCAVGNSIYHKECIELPLVSFKRALKGGYLADVHSMANLLRRGEKALNQEIIKNSRTNVFVATSRKSDGKLKLFNLKDLSDMVSAIEASFAIVGASNHITIDNVDYIDGALSMPFPPKEIIDKLDPTHIFIIANKTERERLLLIHKIIAKWMVRKTKHLEPEILKWQEKYDKSLSDLRDNSQKIPYLIAWSGKDVFPLEKNPKKLISVTKKANKHTKDLFKKYNLIP